MTPEQLAKSGTEHAHQTALMAWAALNTNKYPELRWLLAIPNGGARSAFTGARLKAEGVKPGVWDLLLPAASPRGARGLWIEMKKPGGKLSDLQHEFGEFVKNQGYYTAVCYSWIEAKEAIEFYLGT